MRGGAILDPNSPAATRSDAGGTGSCSTPCTTFSTVQRARSIVTWSGSRSRFSDRPAGRPSAAIGASERTASVGGPVTFDRLQSRRNRRHGRRNPVGSSTTTAGSNAIPGRTRRPSRRDEAEQVTSPFHVTDDDGKFTDDTLGSRGCAEPPGSALAARFGARAGGMRRPWEQVGSGAFALSVTTSETGPGQAARWKSELFGGQSATVGMAHAARRPRAADHGALRRTAERLYRAGRALRLRDEPWPSQIGPEVMVYDWSTQKYKDNDVADEAATGRSGTTPERSSSVNALH